MKCGSLAAVTVIYELFDLMACPGCSQLLPKEVRTFMSDCASAIMSHYLIIPVVLVGGDVGNGGASAMVVDGFVII